MRDFAIWYNGGMCLAQKNAAWSGTEFKPPEDWVALAKIFRDSGVSKLPIKPFWQEEDEAIARELDRRSDAIKAEHYSLMDAIEDAPNYRPATTKERCSTCVSLQTARPDGSGWTNCERYDFECDRNYVCDSHAFRQDNEVPPEAHKDAEPIQVEGELLSEQDWEALADVSDADAEVALKQWKKTAPEQFAEILDAQNP